MFSKKILYKESIRKYLEHILIFYFQRRNHVNKIRTLNSNTIEVFVTAVTIGYGVENRR